MSMTFEHTTLGQRVLFGTGLAGQNLAAEIDRTGASRPMVVAGGSARDRAQHLSADIHPVLWWDEVVMHVPVDLAERARAAATEAEVDIVISVGGGSTTGLAKAIALTHGIPIIAVPTTYSGSEGTNVWGLTEDGTKTTGPDPRVLPATVIYDAELSATLPVELSVVSALNGMAHCVDSLWAPRADPINEALALEGARALSRALTGIVEDPTDMSAREQALYGCYLAAVSFVGAGSGLHHKICHVLGGTFNLPHAQTHAIVLPHVLAFNAAAVPESAGRLAAALEAGTAEAPAKAATVPSANATEDPAAEAVQALQGLYERVGAPRCLDELGFTADDIPGAIERIRASAPASNPVEVTVAGLTELLMDALNGQPPR